MISSATAWTRWIDLRQPLAVLVNRMPWQEIEASLAHRLAQQVNAGKNIEDLDPLGSVSCVVGGGASNVYEEPLQRHSRGAGGWPFGRDLQRGGLERVA